MNDDIGYTGHRLHCVSYSVIEGCGCTCDYEERTMGNKTSVPCPECGGSGRDEFGECGVCHGHGYVLRENE